MQTRPKQALYSIVTQAMQCIGHFGNWPSTAAPVPIWLYLVCMTEEEAVKFFTDQLGAALSLPPETHQKPTDTKDKPPLGVAAASRLRAIADLLESKSAQYGDSAGKPLRLFTTASVTEMLLVRIEDKVSRLVRGSSDQEDTVNDLIGYLAMAAESGWKGNGK